LAASRHTSACQARPRARRPGRVGHLKCCAMTRPHVRPVRARIRAGRHRGRGRRVDVRCVDVSVVAGKDAFCTRNSYVHIYAREIAPPHTLAAHETLETCMPHAHRAAGRSRSRLSSATVLVSCRFCTHRPHARTPPAGRTLQLSHTSVWLRVDLAHTCCTMHAAHARRQRPTRACSAWAQLACDPPISCCALRLERPNPCALRRRRGLGGFGSTDARAARERGTR
jgi:hypothetical protein